MDPEHLGRKYDRIAHWWHDRHENSTYGVAQIKKALNFCPRTETALDVGCGAGGRVVRLLEARGFAVTGLDVSAAMTDLARRNHPASNFLRQDICTWEAEQAFDFIVAWDSIFHLPLASQRPVVARLCRMLAVGGVLIYTFGDAVGEHLDRWHDDEFYYSSIGIDANLMLLRENGVCCKHLELDQWPQNHVYLIGVKGG